MTWNEYRARCDRLFPLLDHANRDVRYTARDMIREYGALIKASLAKGEA